MVWLKLPIMQIATYKNQPLPNISLQRLRELMKDTNPTKDL